MSPPSLEPASAAPVPLSIETPPPSEGGPFWSPLPLLLLLQPARLANATSQGHTAFAFDITASKVPRARVRVSEKSACTGDAPLTSSCGLPRERSLHKAGPARRLDRPREKRACLKVCAASGRPFPVLVGARPLSSQ